MQVADGLTYLKFTRNFYQTTKFNNLYPLWHRNNFHWEHAHTDGLTPGSSNRDLPVCAEKLEGSRLGMANRRRSNAVLENTVDLLTRLLNAITDSRQMRASCMSNRMMFYACAIRPALQRLSPKSVRQIKNRCRDAGIRARLAVKPGWLAGMITVRSSIASSDHRYFRTRALRPYRSVRRGRLRTNFFSCSSMAWTYLHYTGQTHSCYKSKGVPHVPRHVLSHAICKNEVRCRDGRPKTSV